MTVEAMEAVGREIAAMPLLDPRSPEEIMDDINEPGGGGVSYTDIKPCV